MIFDQSRARKLMQEQDVDVLVASSRKNFGYVSGFFDHGGADYEGTYDGRTHLKFAVVCKEKEAFLVTLSGWQGEINDEDPWIKDRKYCGPKYRVAGVERRFAEDPYECLAKGLADRGLDNAKVGVELTYDSLALDIVSVNMLEMLRKSLPRATFKDASPIIRKLRMIKSQEEVRILQK